MGVMGHLFYKRIVFIHILWPKNIYFQDKKSTGIRVIIWLAHSLFLGIDNNVK